MSSVQAEATKYMYGVRLDTSLAMAGFTILYYDYAITVLSEIQFCWTQPKLKPSFMLFVINRYLGLIGPIPLFLEYFLQNADEHGIVAILMILRTYALYHGSKRILVLLVAMHIGGDIHCIVAVVTSKSPLSTNTPLDFNFPWCNTSLTNDQGVHLALAWSAMLWFDTIIFVLTLYKAIQMRREISAGGLIERLFRDGTIYYGILVALNMINIITFLKTPANSPMKGMATVITNVMSVTLTSRLMLHLRDPSLVGGRRIGPTSQWTDRPGFSTGQFSTRISFGRQPTATDTEGMTMEELGTSVGTDSDCQNRVCSVLRVCPTVCEQRLSIYRLT
ncbi:hypothetical protein BD413DRAFT_11766 [Trametes elegans]|nr:hypothetical protein BD413DRAFT_11766 [Trametes elegans]